MNRKAQRCLVLAHRETGAGIATVDFPAGLQARGPLSVDDWLAARCAWMNQVKRRWHRSLAGTQNGGDYEVVESVRHESVAILNVLPRRPM